MSSFRLCLPFALAIFCTILSGCSKPLDSLINMNRIALVSVEYDPTLYTFQSHSGVDRSNVYAEFTGETKYREFHERSLNEFLVELMSRTNLKLGVSIVRPLTLIDTSLMQDNDTRIRYEYLLEPYDPIDINDRLFMAGLAKRMRVDAVAKVQIGFALLIDNTDMWEDYEKATIRRVMSYRQRLRTSHDTSQLRTEITITVVDQYADQIYQETRFVDVDTDMVHVEDADLAFPGGVSPKLIDLGLKHWLDDWERYL